MNKYDAMISYTVEPGDKELANFIYEYLTDKGLDIWFSAKQLKPGLNKSIAQSISKAIIKSDFAICIISKEYLKPRWSSVELDTVLELMIHNEIKIIPVLWNITAKELRQRYPLLSSYMWISDNEKEKILDKVYSVLTATPIPSESSSCSCESEKMKKKKNKLNKKKESNRINTFMGNSINSKESVNIDFGDKISTYIERQFVNQNNIDKQVNIYINDGVFFL